MLGWIANKMLEPEWDSFKKAIAVTDHWKARAEKAEAERDALKMSEEESGEVISDLRAERDQLRAEVENITAWANSKSDEVLELRAEVGELIEANRGLSKDNGTLALQVGKLHAALAAAKEDTERLDWLETQDVWIGIRGEYEAVPDYACGGECTMKVRDAIDAAREGIANNPQP